MTLLDVMRAEGGFTFDPRAGELVKIGETSGFAIAVPGTERVLGSGDISREEFADAFVAVVRSYGALIDAGACVGGWYSQDRDMFMVEVSEIHHVNRETAVALGIARNQEAILDLATGEFIATGGTGDATGDAPRDATGDAPRDARGDAAGDAAA